MANAIDTFGWDTVFGIHYDHLNTAFKKNNAKLPDFKNWVDPTSQVGINGSWNYFQVSNGGSGQDLQMMCNLTGGNSSIGGDFKDAWLKIQVNLAMVPNPDYPAKDKTGTGGTVHTMSVNAAGTATNPAVSIISSDFPNVKPGLLKSALPEIFQNYFIANIAQFNQIFAAVDINVIADKGDYQWLKPTYTTYACADTVGGGLNQGVFAVLSKTDNGLPTGLSQQVDNRILQSLPDGANSALALSPQKILQHIFMQGVVYTIQGSKLEDFEINNDSLWITNKNDVVWGNFTLDNGKIITPTIKAGNFQVGLVDQTVQLQIIDAAAKWPDWKGPGEIDIHMNITQHFEFSLKQKPSGGYVFVPKPDTEGTSVKAITTNVTVSEGVTIFEICIGIAVSIIGAVVGGAIGGLFDAGSSVVAKTTEEAVITITEDSINEISEQAGKEAVENAEKEAVEGAVEGLENAENPSFATKFKNAITANKWKLFGGAMGGILTAPVGMISEFMTLVADGDLDKIPSFDDFAASSIGATTFPNGTGWDLKSAGLNGPLVITGDLKSADN